MLARKTVLVLASTLFIKGIEVLIFFLATRKYDKGEFGYLTLARSLFAFFLFFSDLNINTAHVKKMSEGIHNKNTYFSTYLLFKAIILPVTTFSFLILIYFEMSMGILDGSPLLVQVLFLLLLSSIISSINLVYQSSFQAEMKAVKMQAGYVVAISIKSLLTILVVLFIEGFIFFASLFLIYELITLGINMFLGRGFRLVKFNRELVKEYTTFSLFVLASTAMSVIYVNFGPLILVNVLGKDSLGVYYIVSRILYFTSLVHQSFGVLLLPRISANLKDNDIDTIRKNHEIYQKYMLILWGIFAIICFGMGVFLLDLLGTTYRDEGLGLLLFEAFFVCFFWAWTPAFVIMMANKDPLYILVTLLCLVLSIISWMVLPSWLGIVALDFGRYASSVPNAIIAIVYLNKKYKFGKPTRHASITFIVILSIIALESITGFSWLPGITSIILTIACLAGFFAVMFITRVLTRDDLRFIKRVLNPRMVLSDVKSEISTV
ncbi:MAG: oligosaccharide flippase family protein [Candidatus Lokiarchaeota archaeon]|nr:oligosaccharide flippase family protein [Candidatus Lokiarchaeota archaeon]